MERSSTWSHSSYHCCCGLEHVGWVLSAGSKPSKLELSLSTIFSIKNYQALFWNIITVLHVRIYYTDHVHMEQLNLSLIKLILSIRRFCQRVIPVVGVCRATLSDIERDAVAVLEPHFHTDDLQLHKVSTLYCRSWSA